MNVRPVALWVSVPFATFGVEVDDAGRVVEAPPIVKRWAVGRSHDNVVKWARRKRGQRFAWIWSDGTIGGEWR